MLSKTFEFKQIVNGYKKKIELAQSFRREVCLGYGFKFSGDGGKGILHLLAFSSPLIQGEALLEAIQVCFSLLLAFGFFGGPFTSLPL